VPRGPRRAVFHDGRKQTLEYVGPGREEPEPGDVAEVRIGYFGPSDPRHPEGGDLWSAAQMAVDEANRQGGLRGKPFRLVPGWSENPWTGGVSLVTRMVYQDKVWALVGGIDGPSTHLAEQITTKALLPLVSPASTDRSANSAFVPWMFSCLPCDDVLAPLVAGELARDARARPFVVVCADDHDSRHFSAKLTRSFNRLNIAPAHQFVYQAVPGDPAPVVKRAAELRPRSVVLLAGPAASALVVKGLRGAGYAGAIYGGPAMGRRLFVEQAGAAAEGVVFPLLYLPGNGAAGDGVARASCPCSSGSTGETPVGGGAAGFACEFFRRFHRSPDYAAAATCDAVTLLVAAVRKAGLNRARIGDALRELSPRQGVTGVIRWDALGGNDRPVRLGTIRGGQPVPLEAPATAAPWVDQRQ